MIAILFIFALAHSGLAGLRAKGENIIGERAYRVMFGLVSLPLAIVALVYFINHRYDGVELWNLRDVAGKLLAIFANVSLSLQGFCVEQR